MSCVKMERHTAARSLAVLAYEDFAGEQAEREADDAGRVSAHPLDREMGLAGVGGPEDRPDRRVVLAGHYPSASGSLGAENK